MADIPALQSWTEAFLSQPPPEPAEELQAAPDDAALAAAAGQQFSTFNPDQLDRAIELSARFMRLATEQGEEGLGAIREEAEQAARTESVELVQHALEIFITHHPLGRRLPFPSLEERAPEKTLPSEAADEGDAALAAGAPESALNWYREDPKANEHHEHWHVVYPNRGTPDVSGSGARRLGDRHGELFYYMHQQMLARYDTERLALGMEPVKPLADYRAPVDEGYDPGPGLRSSPGNQNQARYSARAPGTRLRDLPGAVTLAEQEAARDLLGQAIAGGAFSDGTPVTTDRLGATAETSIASAGPSYGNHHGNGHVLLAFGAGSQTPGVMIDTATAIRDPAFYRWHKHVDDLCFRAQERLTPHDFSDAPRARVRKAPGGAAGANQSPDILLCFKSRLPGGGDGAFDGQAWGRATFGGANWDTDFTNNPLTTGELITRMLQRPVRQRDGTTVSLTYLDQDEFVYFLRAENLAPTALPVTVRLFLVAQQAAENRRMWIEMDKFQHTLGPSEKAVIYRPAALSSVIRKPGRKPPEAAGRPGDSADANEDYCSCGWPYNLLLPRGTREGMRFRLLAMLTDGNRDDVRQSTCGSMSFCGARNQPYPDRRPMGYPFDRPFPGGSIAQTIARRDNMATRDIIIRWA